MNNASGGAEEDAIAMTMGEFRWWVQHPEFAVAGLVVCPVRAAIMVMALSTSDQSRAEPRSQLTNHIDINKKESSRVRMETNFLLRKTLLRRGYQQQIAVLANKSAAAYVRGIHFDDGREMSVLGEALDL